MKKSLLAFLLLAVAGLFTGCVTQLQSQRAPGTDLAALHKIYVVRLDADHRGVDKLIADRLGVMGFQATSGEKAAVPADADGVVTYQDKWMWDMTMYMISLDVQVRKPVSDVAIASGHVLRTSLARKSPPEMVEEVLNDVFKSHTS